eukprot:3379697-Alexandrium_andersonii.AAC.1
MHRASRRRQCLPLAPVHFGAQWGPHCNASWVVPSSERLQAERLGAQLDLRTPAGRTLAGPLRRCS